MFEVIIRFKGKHHTFFARRSEIMLDDLILELRQYSTDFVIFDGDTCLYDEEERN